MLLGKGIPHDELTRSAITVPLLVLLDGAQARPTVITPPLTRKRKATNHSQPVTGPKRAKQAPTDREDQISARTPVSEPDQATTPSMDSDDDMVSAASGDDMDFDDGTQASDIDSGMWDQTYGSCHY